MLSDRVSNPGPLTYESGALLIALRGPAIPYITGYAKYKFNVTLINVSLINSPLHVTINKRAKRP